MGFFATFWVWLNGQLAAYIGNNTARLAGVLEPAVMTVATVYVMVWGYLHLTGQIEEPFVDGLKRVIMLAVILGVGLHLWLYNALIVDTFYNAPTQLAAAVIGAGDPVATIDAIWTSGGTVAGNLWVKGGVLNGGIGFLIAGAMVWCLMGMLCIYAMFLIALSSIALAVLLALGPLFIAMLFFDSTKRFFSAWIAQLATYALITILTVMISALLLQMVQSYAVQTAATGRCDIDRRCTQHGVDRGARFFDPAADHADRRTLGGRPRLEFVRNVESRRWLEHAKSKCEVPQGGNGRQNLA